MVIESSSNRLEQLLSGSRAIYIIDGAGKLLHHEYFLGQQDDPHLYSGLFAAVNVYAKELKAGVIKSIELGENKFVLTEHNETGHLIVMDLSMEINDEDGGWLLTHIVDRFAAMQQLLEEDFKGSLTLKTLFEERGKAINWDTIHEIRQDAVDNQKVIFDKVTTLNLTKINLNNHTTWSRIRKVVSVLVESHLGLEGILLYILNHESTNILYSGRRKDEKDRLEVVQEYINNKLLNQIGLELETELIQVNEFYCSIFPLLCAEGGVLAAISTDKYLISRLNSQMERLVASIERLGV
ncbi:MAG: hypothetical protein OEY49_02625 [Candidatus Heimdallarchaeota archaeon]|nr:hypothetical protein [Candidatus Heimdallarchaeota archaeon]